MAGGESWAGRLVAALAGLLLAYAALRVLAPFVSVLSAAAIVAVVVRPLKTGLRPRLSRTAAAGLVSAAVCVALAAPLSLGAWYLARESARAYPLLRDRLEDLARLQDAQPPPWVPGPAQGFLRDLDVRALLLENVRELGSWSGRLASSMIAGAAGAAVRALVFALGLFVFLRDGREVLERLRAAAPLPRESKDRILERARDMIIATVQGVFAVAILQGALAMIGFALFGVRFPVLLGALCMLLSPIPFVGSTLVWLPVVARAAFAGQPAKAALLAVWFTIVVGTSDNAIRPFLIGSRARLPVAVVVVGLLGGLEAFGPIGIFLGPVIMALLAAVLDSLLQESGRGAA